MVSASDELQGTGLRSLAPPPPLGDMQDPALFLDFDGTLVDIAPRPDAIFVAPELPGLLEALSKRLDGRLALVSGRSLADLAFHLGTLDIAMAGSHGGEIHEAGAAGSWSLTEPMPEHAKEALRRIAEELGGLLIETKPCGAAIHYREQPAAEQQVLVRARALADAEGLKLKRGKMVAELVMPGSDKGSAVAQFMARAPFAGTKPIFLGDDVTDEDAFSVAARLGGGGILVGPMRETAASWRIASIADALGWLRTALA